MEEIAVDVRVGPTLYQGALRGREYSWREETTPNWRPEMSKCRKPETEHAGGCSLGVGDGTVAHVNVHVLNSLTTAVVLTGGYNDH